MWSTVTCRPVLKRASMPRRAACKSSVEGGVGRLLHKNVRCQVEDVEKCSGQEAVHHSTGWGGRNHGRSGDETQPIPHLLEPPVELEGPAEVRIVLRRLGRLDIAAQAVGLCLNLGDRHQFDRREIDEFDVGAPCLKLYPKCGGALS